MGLVEVDEGGVCQGGEPGNETLRGQKIECEVRKWGNRATHEDFEPGADGRFAGRDWTLRLRRKLESIGAKLNLNERRKVSPVRRRLADECTHEVVHE